jgi:ABC-type amino acid transport substrate-binding protein
MKIATKSKWGRSLILWCAAGSLAFLAWFLFGRQRIDYTKVYRIGYGNDAPLHFNGPDGLPTGLAVELVREAARREGIKLQWVDMRKRDPNPPPLDLTVLQKIRPERSATVHFTEPYLESDSCFVVLDSSPVRQVSDLRTARIAFLNFKVHRDNLGSLLPGAQLAPTDSSKEALSRMTAGLADAAYLDQYAVLTAMRSGGVPAPIRILGTGLPKSKLGIASPLANAAVADAIRQGMRSMGDDGSVATLVERWAFFPHLTADVIRDLAATERSNRWLAGGFAGLALVLLFTTWLALRLRRDITERKRVEATLRGKNAELSSALAKVRTLTGMLPICAGCKKIRDDKNYWSEVEIYVMKHTDAQFTHGYCPTCVKKYFSEFGGVEKA